MKKCKLFLFDLDRTLLQSEKQYQQEHYQL